MAQVKVFKLGPNGVPRQHNTTADEITMLTLQGGNIKLQGNSVTSENTDGNINLDPNGTGLVQINSAYTLPGADGVAGQVLTTNGLGTVTFQDVPTSSAVRICTDYTASGAIADRAAVYISGASTVTEADASLESTARVIGFADGAIADTAVGSICHDGVLDGFVGLTPGARYFLSETTGDITTTPPSSDEAAVVQVGYAKSATELHVDIEVIVEIETD